MAYNILNVAKDIITCKLEYASDEDVLARADICRTCDANMKGLCTACGCIIAAKIKLAKSECPMELWGPVEGTKKECD